MVVLPGIEITSLEGVHVLAIFPLRYTQYAGISIPYAATADLPANSVDYYFYRSDITTWNGYDPGFTAQTIWAQNNTDQFNQRYFVTITGNYPAGTAGGNAAHNDGWDDIHNGFQISRPGQLPFWTYATTRITYVYGTPTNAITAPGYVNPGQSYAVSATTNDPQLTDPVTWSLYVDGALWGTAADPQFTVNAGDANTSQQLQLVATDGSGHSVSGYGQVMVGSGCGTQVIC